MPRVRDLLYRFRPAGTPGAAGQAGVPADRAAETAAELEPLFARLADTEQECREILAQARRDAAQIRELGLRQAQAVVGDAGGRGEVERTMTAAQLSQDGEREADTERRRAEAAVSALHQRAAEMVPAYVDAVVNRVAALVGRSIEPTPAVVDSR